MMNYFIDIDGTLTDVGSKAWGKVIPRRLEAVKRLARDGKNTVVLWTGGGAGYAREFAERHGLEGVLCLGKPDVIVDDMKTLRPCLTDEGGKFHVEHPNLLDGL